MRSALPHPVVQRQLAVKADATIPAHVAAAPSSNSAVLDPWRLLSSWCMCVNVRQSSFMAMEVV